MSSGRDRTLQQQFERARDELFSHIHRCGVLQAAEEHQLEWMDDTLEYLGERYPELGTGALDELKQIGVRFCRPVIQHEGDPTADDTRSEPAAGDDEAAAA